MDNKLKFEPMSYFNQEILIYLQNEVFKNVFSWPDGVVVEEAETRKSDEYGKWSESVARVSVDGVVAAEMAMRGKYGDDIQDFKIVDKSALVELFKKIIEP